MSNSISGYYPSNTLQGLTADIIRDVMPLKLDIFSQACLRRTCKRMWSLIRPISIPDADVCRGLARNGYLSLLKRATVQGYFLYQYSVNAAAAAVEGGHIHVLEWITEVYPGFTNDEITRLVHVAAKNGDLRTLQWLQTKYPLPHGKTIALTSAQMGHRHILESLIKQGYSFQGDCLVTVHAAKGGQLGMMKWLVVHEALLTEQVFHEAAKSGCVPMLEWLKEKNCPRSQAEVCTIAAKAGHCDVLQWEVVENQFPWDPQLCFGAVINGHLDVVVWAIDRGYPLPMEAKLCELAAKKGRLDVLQKLRGKGVPWNEETFEKAAKYGRLEILKWARSNGCPSSADFVKTAVVRGHFDILLWVWEEKIPFKMEERLCSLAALQGRLDILQLLRKKECPWNEEVCREATRNGHFEIMQWAVEQGCPLPMTAELCAQVANYGRLDILQWLRERNCPWDKATWYFAALKGHMAILEWAHAHGCPKEGEMYHFHAVTTDDFEIIELFRRVNYLKWVLEKNISVKLDVKFCAYAALRGRLDVLQMLRNKGCPWDVHTWINATKFGHTEVAEWAKNAGCPLPGSENQTGCSIS